MASEGPRATVKRTAPFNVGLGPSHATRACERVPLAMLRSTRRSRGTGPRATVSGTVTIKNAPFTVGRGPVPRHATIAGDRPPRYGACNDREGQALALRSLKRSRGTGPRATVKTTAPFTVGRGPSHATRASERVPLAMHHAAPMPPR